MCIYMIVHFDRIYACSDDNMYIKTYIHNSVRIYIDIILFKINRRLSILFKRYFAVHIINLYIYGHQAIIYILSLIKSNNNTLEEEYSIK